jgi:hypothetical protein
LVGWLHQLQGLEIFDDGHLCPASAVNSPRVSLIGKEADVALSAVRKYGQRQGRAGLAGVPDFEGLAVIPVQQQDMDGCGLLSLAASGAAEQEDQAAHS